MASRLIVALDVDSAAEAQALVVALGPAADHYKVGLQLLVRAGPDVVRSLVAAGKQVFLDLKLHEIPASVANAVHAAGELGCAMVTVHASAGPAVLRAAVEAAREHPRLQVLALTVITSLGDADLPAIGLPPSVPDQVLRLAQLAADAGCHGVVASAQEAARLRGVLPAGALIVCPGIQWPDAGGAGQVRTATPAAAARAGASHIVPGRALTAASDPAAAFRAAAAAFDAAR